MAEKQKHSAKTVLEPVIEPVIGILSAGEMGAGIGAALNKAGVETLTITNGRGAETLARVQESGMGTAENLEDLLNKCDILLSILPPAAAKETAREIAQAITMSPPQNLKTAPVFIECNAISPDAVKEIATFFAPLNMSFIDAGIIGAPPEITEEKSYKPRLYLSGPPCPALQPIDGIGFDMVWLGPHIGQASAMKMTYAALTKGINSMLSAALLTAARNDLLPPLLEELNHSQKALLTRAENNIARLPADAARWAPEMREISATFSQAGLPGGFHQGAAELMELLARSRFGAETRRTRDRSRTMEQTIMQISDDMNEITPVNKVKS